MSSASMLWTLLTLPSLVYTINFPYEQTTLASPTDPLFSFGSLTSPAHFPHSPENCRINPSSPLWPTPLQWSTFNSSLSGALIKGVPPALVCYNGSSYDAAKCAVVRAQYFNTRTWARGDDPVMIENEWLDGDSCAPWVYGNVAGGGTTRPRCDVEAYPAYVVNVTNVKQIQLAVNFARNTGIRLIIKNTGHSLLGQSAGAGSLSIWTHLLKSFTYLPSYTSGNYTGRAAAISAGMQNQDLQPLQGRYNITLVLPGGPTVGVGGGWFMGGGHGFHTSKLGLGADQVLAVEMVTADGRFISANAESHSDLFWAVRGGGGTSWGIITSIIVKAYDPIIASIAGSITFSNGLVPGTPTVSTSVFWTGVNLYFAFAPKICDAGGTGFNFIYNLGNGTYRFTTVLFMPGMTAAEANLFANPLYLAMQAAGLNISNPNVVTKRSTITPTSGILNERRQVAGSLVDTIPMPYPSRGAGQTNLRLASRLFPRLNLEDPKLFNLTMSTIQRSIVEGGYTFHSANHCPTRAVSGWPDNAVLEAYRETAMHAQMWDDGVAIGSVEGQAERYRKFARYFQEWKDVSPGAGSYMNEADPSETDWQWSFYGKNYPRLLAIKKKYDPWGLFWAKAAVGSEGWEAKTPFPSEVPTQNGKLYRMT